MNTPLPSSVIDGHVHMGADGASWGDLTAQMAAAGVERAVLAQSTPDGTATQEALKHAEASEAIGASVAWVDVAAADVGEALDRLTTFPKFRGVALPVHLEADNHWLVSEEVVRGLRAVAERGLTVDAEVAPRQLPSVERLAQLLPDLGIAVAHIGSPFIARSEREPWGVYMLNVAPHRNVRLKLSGLLSLDTTPWSVAHLRLFVDSVVRLFGYERLMFGSDWPAHLSRASYAEVLAATLEAAGAMTVAQCGQLFDATAREFYRIA